MKDAPIGIFDSGLGGLSVLAEAAGKMPHENFIFFGDNGHAPYGSKSREEILGRASFIVDFLLNKGVKAIVIACNTATGVAVKELRERHHLPIISMEPAVKLALEHRRAGKIVVMATPATLMQDKYQLLIDRLDCRADVIPLPCAGLVELIEGGKIGGEEIHTFLRNLLQPLSGRTIGAVVLGCTHYVFVKDAIADVLDGMGKRPVIVDGAQGTVNHLQDLLVQTGQYRDSGERMIQIFTSGDPEAIRPVICEIIGDQKIEVV